MKLEFQTHLNKMVSQWKFPFSKKISFLTASVLAAYGLSLYFGIWEKIGLGRCRSIDLVSSGLRRLSNEVKLYFQKNKDRSGDSNSIEEKQTKLSLNGGAEQEQLQPKEEELPKAAPQWRPPELQLYFFRQEGAFFGFTFEYRAKPVAFEEAHRVNTVGIYAKSHFDHLEFIQKEINGADSGRDILLRKKQLLLNRNLSVRDALRRKRTWAASGSYRHIEEKKEVYDSYLPLSVNLRKHILKDISGNTLCVFFRAGALTDPRNGAVNIAEIFQLIKQLERPHVYSLTEEQKRLLSVIDPDDKENLSVNNVKEFLQSVYEERLYFLQCQFLQELTAHLADANIDSFGARIPFARVSLLDSNKSFKEDGEQVIDERNQLLDQKYIYQFMDNKTLLFDGRGPFVDEEGVIHLPMIKTGGGNPVQKTLRTYLCNISVATNQENIGEQAVVNKTFFRKIIKDFPNLEESMGSLQNDINEPKISRFWIAQKIIENLFAEQILVIVNCFSAKDRTGGLGACLIFASLEELCKDWAQNEREEFLAKAARDLVNHKEGIAIRIIQDNTGETALKLNPFDSRLPFLDREGSISLRLSSNVTKAAIGVRGHKAAVSQRLTDSSPGGKGAIGY